MNIIIVGTAYPLRGGIAHYNALLASHLAKRHNVHTITFKRQYPTFLFPGKTQDESGSAGNLTPAPQLVDSINPLNWLSVAKEIRKLKPDLIIFKYWLPFFGPCFGTIARFTRRNAKTKALFICDNIIPHERRLGDVTFTRYAFKQADFFIVQSDAVERDLKKYFPTTTYKKVPHPVYENFGTPIAKQEAKRSLGIDAKRVLLYFGYIRPYKGLFTLIEAMKNVSGVLLLVVGEFYDDESKYRQRVRDLNLESSIRFVSDYIPNERVASYFSAADVVVLPYLSATQSGIVQIAYNFNKPVIVTNVGGLAETVVDGKTGFIAAANNPDSLASCINKFYAGNKEAEFVENVTQEKKKYTWDAMVQAIEELAK